MKERFYRGWSRKNPDCFRIKHLETDLFITAKNRQRKACLELIKELRCTLNNYIEKNPKFETSLKPVIVPENAPQPVQEMAQYAKKAGVGPMAAVAGLFSERIGRLLAENNSEVIVENGGDLFLKLRNEKTIGLYAGKNSPFTGHLGFRIIPQETPLGVCTSSGTVGHSLSRGSADVAVVLSSSSVLADAYATASCNMISSEKDLDKTAEWISSQDNISGFLAAKNDKIVTWGNVKPVATKVKS